MKQFILFLGLSLVLAANGLATPSAAEPITLALNLRGTGEPVGTLDQVAEQLGLALGEDIAGASPASYGCNRADVFELATDQKLGDGFSCVTNVSMLENGTLTLVEAIVFDMPEGMVAAVASVTLQPFVDGYGNGGEPARTYLSGAVPSADNVVLATGKFAGMHGTSRVSGAMTVTEPPFFDCIFVLRLTAS